MTYSATNGTRSAGVIHWYGGDGFWIGVAQSQANRSRYNATGPHADFRLIVDGLLYLHRLPPRVQWARGGV